LTIKHIETSSSEEALYACIGNKPKLTHNHKRLWSCLTTISAKLLITFIECRPYC